MTQSKELTLQVLRKFQAQQEAKLSSDFPADDPRYHYVQEELEKTEKAIQWVIGVSTQPSVMERRVKIGICYTATGYGRGTNKRNVYLIDGYAYAYHPAYAAQAFTPLTGELEGYVPVNAHKLGDEIFFTQCSSERTGHEAHSEYPFKQEE